MAALLLAAASATAGAAQIGHLISYFNFELAPVKLSPTQPRHVRMSLSGRYETSETTHIPALRELKLEGDRHLALDLKGVPACVGPHYDYKGALEDACGDAVIGRGELTVEVAFPEEPVMTVTGDLTLYKGGHLGKVRHLLANALLPAPVSGEVHIPITIEKSDGGRFGWTATAAVSKIAGGYGSITAYSVRIGKRFLTATCQGGRLQMRTLSSFTDGTKLPESAIRTCSVPKADARQ